VSNLFSSILSGLEKDYDVVKAAIETTWTKATTAFPILKTDAAAAISALKQQASNAFAFADTELAPKYADAVSMAESAADTLVMSLTGGVAAPAIPLFNVGVTQGFALLHAALDHAEAAAKATFALPPPTSSAQPTVAGVGAAVASAVAATAG
jgi:hypothetical protein